MANLSFGEVGVILTAFTTLETEVANGGRWTKRVQKETEAAREILARLSDLDAMSCDTCGRVLDAVAIEAGRTQCFECYCEHQG
jgi:hypothetical protein